MTTWDNQTIDHADNPVVISFDKNDVDTFKITVNAPFYNDPSGPNGYIGEPFYGLWNYEGKKKNKIMTSKNLFYSNLEIVVAEVFFLNDDNQYVEIELSP